MRTPLLAALLALGLCSCAQSVDAPLSPTFGKAVAAMDTQIIPAKVSDQPPEGSGVVGVAALGRYETDKVYKPESQSTSQLGSSGMAYSGK